MGCLLSGLRGRLDSLDENELHQAGLTHGGKNRPLLKDPPLWKSEMPITAGQLMSKRDEFWDTAPAFDGRREIWDALKAAVAAFETKDHELAQAIVDGASITLPYGSLGDCYDELGNRYQVPIYMLAYPINFLDESPAAATASEDLEPASQSGKGHTRTFSIRISTTNEDHSISLSENSTILEGKLEVERQFNVSANLQRWFFGGKVLLDKSTLASHKLPEEHLIQVIRKLSAEEREKLIQEEKDEEDDKRLPEEPSPLPTDETIAFSTASATQNMTEVSSNEVSDVASTEASQPPEAMETVEVVPPTEPS
jgi:hypothetical protein